MTPSDAALKAARDLLDSLPLDDEPTILDAHDYGSGRTTRIYVFCDGVNGEHAQDCPWLPFVAAVRTAEAEGVWSEPSTLLTSAVDWDADTIRVAIVDDQELIFQISDG